MRFIIGLLFGLGAGYAVGAVLSKQAEQAGQDEYGQVTGRRNTYSRLFAGEDRTTDRTSTA